MFSINESLTDLKVKDRNIFKILYSMNSHPVAMPGLASEEARCYILFFSEGTNLSAFIGLYLARVDRRFFYSCTSNPFPFEAQQDVEDEARNFAEEMGFLLDEINVGGMAADDRNHWIEEQLIFGYKHPEAEKGEEKTSSPAAAAPQPAVAQEPEAPEQIEQVEAPAAVPQQAPAPQPAQPSVQPPVYQPAPLPPVQPQYQPQPPSVPPQQPQVYQPTPPQPAQPAYQPQPPAVQPPQAPVVYPPPAQQAYYPAPGVAPEPPQPPLELHVPPVLETPVLEHPEDRVTGTQPTPPPQKAPVKKKVAAKAAPLPVREEQAEDEVPVEFEVEDRGPKPRSLFEEAIKQGVVKPLKPKAVKAAPSATGVVPRDKEALARLLASF